MVEYAELAWKVRSPPDRGEWLGEAVQGMNTVGNKGPHMRVGGGTCGVFSRSATFRATSVVPSSRGCMQERRPWRAIFTNFAK